MTLHNNMDSDFIQACNMVDKEFSHEQLINMLESGDISQKQLSALLLDTLNNKNDGKILINNLTGCDGKIREAVALKINRLLYEDSDIADFLNHPEIFADATIDINANICRSVIDSVAILRKNEYFTRIYLNKIISFINEAFSEIDKFIYKDKKYVINKQLFKLYWCLESLKLFTDEIAEDKLIDILKRATEENEYTIREKVAQIVILKNSDKFNELKNKLINDENYYVKNVFKINAVN